VTLLDTRVVATWRCWTPASSPRVATRAGTTRVSGRDTGVS